MSWILVLPVLRFAFAALAFAFAVMEARDRWPQLKCKLVESRGQTWKMTMHSIFVLVTVGPALHYGLALLDHGSVA
jgi:hypothetical protein